MGQYGEKPIPWLGHLERLREDHHDILQNGILGVSIRKTFSRILQRLTRPGKSLLAQNWSEWQLLLSEAKILLPLVPGGPAIPGSGSGYGNGLARGVKNLRQRFRFCRRLEMALGYESIELEKRENAVEEFFLHV
ncbi:jg17127 [Pararge aegeria aegeria]|uniref:Jg17127 protein n=1 Tax=Pararge aegeria aegeria TaxID=348720 RepID=A0A8S4S9D2_9NEOP|nr:jg17127 [Pararge aegeria aegeria]